ncbi:hypothetical protein P3T40_001815 [Paraburkholderia sp. EB58]
MRITRVKVGNRQAPQQQTETPPRKRWGFCVYGNAITATVQHLGSGIQAKFVGKGRDRVMGEANIFVSFRLSIDHFLSICNKLPATRHASFQLR